MTLSTAIFCVCFVLCVMNVLCFVVCFKNVDVKTAPTSVAVLDDWDR